MSAGRLSYEPWTPNENKEETLRQEMWGTVMSWLKVKFGSAITEEDLDDRQLLLLRTVMRHEEDCRVCTDAKDCPHSGARYVAVLSEVNGFNRVTVAAECGQSFASVHILQSSSCLIAALKRSNCLSSRSSSAIADPNLTFSQDITVPHISCLSVSSLFALGVHGS